ncbi:MAG: glycosyltransferase family 39 protein [Chloroflexota bacterium]|nr:glycosyltransferase family 39 protein [Dehalococcoidia bacterium]MDW8253942.1 glycosyltransferase family 39 protein [Chloroflexota bacterium]
MPGRAAQALALLVPCGLTLLAFALRVTTLTAQSVWNDEAGSLWHARQPVAAIVAGVEPDHLPLYFLLLKGWVALAGASDFAARFSSLLPSVLTVPLIWWLGRRLVSAVAAGTAALVAALSPAALYYGQEIRMYALLPPLAILALGSFLEAANGRRRWWIVHAASLTALAHLHFFGALFIPVSWALALGRAALSGGGRWRAGWAAAQAAVAALTLPLVLVRLSAASAYQSASAGDLTLVAAVWRGAVGLLLGHHLERVTAVVRDGLATADHLLSLYLLLPLLLVLLVGLIPSRRDGWPVLAPALLVPIVGIAVPLLTGRDFVSRYLMVVAPPLWLLLGVGVTRLARWWRPLGIVGVVAVAGPAVVALARYHEPAYARDDFRAAAAYVSAHLEPGDIVLLNAGYAFKAFEHYFVGDAPVIALPAPHPPDDPRLEEATTRAGAGAPRAWLVLWQDYYSDPRGVVQRTLERDGIQIDGRAFHGVNVARYLLLRPFPPGAAPSVVRRAEFGGEIRLLGYDLVADPPDNPARRAGVVRVRLFWEALRPLAASYRVVVQLVNPVYHVYAAKDNRPVDDRFPTTSWPVGTAVIDEYRLVLLSGTPPGEYQLSIGVYDEATGQRLRVDGGDRTDLLLGPVRIARSGGLPNPEHPVAVRFGDVADLLGYDLAGTARPGSRLRLTLHWRARTPAPGLTVFVHLVDAEGALAAQKDSEPAAGGYPTDRWQPGEYLRDFYDLDLPPTLAPGRYQIRVGLYRGDGERLLAEPGNPDRSATLAALAVLP